MLRVLPIAVFSLLFFASTASAQIGGPRTYGGGTQVPTLDETLVNRMRATRTEQQDFIEAVVQKTQDGKLETSLVIAVMRYAERKNAAFPFPFFERAMRHQAARRGVNLPTVQVVSTGRY